MLVTPRLLVTEGETRRKTVALSAEDSVRIVPALTASRDVLDVRSTAYVTIIRYALSKSPSDDIIDMTANNRKMFIQIFSVKSVLTR